MTKKVELYFPIDEVLREKELRKAPPPNDHKFFQNRDCPYFPCHDMPDGQHLNCLFCYCPMYFIKCPGTYELLPDGRKDCMGCTLNHEERAWDIVMGVMKNPQRFPSFPKK